MKTERIPTEHEEQRQFVKWFRQTWPHVKIFAIPNGGARNPATASRLKAEGVLSGVPDLFVPAWNLWVEMKRAKKGNLSTSQKEFLKYLEKIGHRTVVGFGFRDAQEKIASHVINEKLDK